MTAFKTMILASVLLSSSIAQAFTPQTGIWSVAAERNGKPGRGFNIDVQNSTLVMQVYGYERDGSSTFYLTSGPIVDNRYSGRLTQYRGGRYFGSGDQSATESGNAGTVSMRFVSGTKGYITFPGEPEKEIARFGFGYSETPQSLLGTWSLLTADPRTEDFFSLFGNMTRISGQTVYSENGITGCRYTGINPGEVACLQMQNGQVIFAARFILSVNDGEGFAGPNTNSVIYPTTVRRLTTPAGVGTGLVIKSADASIEKNIRALDEALTKAIDKFSKQED